MGLADRLRQHWTRHAAPADRRVKALMLTADGIRLRDAFWQSLIEDPGPLAPLGVDDLGALVLLLEKVSVDDALGSGARRAAEQA